LGIGGAADRTPFFLAGLGGRSDDLILNCYRLAKYYNRHPDEFLSQPVSAILRHQFWTSKLLERTQPDEDEE
jgi:hypothetical protein